MKRRSFIKGLLFSVLTPIALTFGTKILEMVISVSCSAHHKGRFYYVVENDPLSIYSVNSKYVLGVDGDNVVLAVRNLRSGYYF